MKQKLIITILFFNLFLNLYSQNNFIINSLDQEINLTDNWHYKIDNKALYTEILNDNNNWNNINFPVDLKLNKDYYLYLKNNFIIDKSLENQKIYLWLGKIVFVMQVFINNIEVGSFGTMPPDYFQTSYEDKFVFIPNGIIKYNEQNTILLKIYYDGSSIFFNKCYFYNEKKYKLLQSLSYFLNKTLYQIFTGVLFFVFLFSLFLFLNNKKNFEYILFGLGCLSFAIYTIHFYMESSIFEFLFTKAITQGIILIAFMFYIIFLAIFYKINNNKKLYIPTIIFALLLYAGMFFQTSTESQRKWFNISLIYLLYTLIITIYLSVTAIKHKNKYALPILIGVLCSLPAALHDTIYSIIGITPITWFQGIALIIFVLSMFYSLARSLMDLYKDVEIKSKELIENKNNLLLLLKENAKISASLSESSKILDTNINLTSKLTNEMINNNKEFNVKIDNEKILIDNINKLIIEISNSISNLNDNIISEAKLIEDTSLSITQLSDNINSIKELSINSFNITNETYDIVYKGYENLKKTTNMINALEKDSENIVSAINIIEDISEKTNILAMNAAIEAARAGKYGEGFGIIAKEVRNLSSVTKKNSNEIRSNLKNILNKIRNFVNDFNFLTKDLEKIIEFSKNTKKIISNINDAIIEESKEVNSIMESTNQLNNYKNNIISISISQKMKSEKIKKYCEDLENISNEILNNIKFQEQRNIKFMEIINILTDLSTKNLNLSILLNNSSKADIENQKEFIKKY